MFKPNSVVVYKNEPSEIPVFMVDKNSELMNLNGITGIVMRIKNADNSILELAVSKGFTWGTGCDVGYIYTFNITAEQIDLLDQGKQPKDIEIKLTFGSSHKLIRYKNFLSLRDEAMV